jgi:flagellum-specific peptidoglycan hydrolase FlgJ
MKKVVIALVIGVIITLIIKRTAVINASKQLYNMLTRPEFINMFGGTAIVATKGTGLFPSVMMAQAILESSDKKGVPGNSTLAKKYNNFFGIKADSTWKGDKATMKTREVIDGKDVYINADFRAYKTPLDSFVDRVAFLKRFSRYIPVFRASTPEQQATALHNAGYSTDPNYDKTLINLIMKNNLKQLDS